MNTPITPDTDLRPLISADDPNVYNNIEAIIDFFYAQVVKACESYDYTNIIGIENLKDGNYYYLRVIVAGLDDDQFNLDLNFFEDGDYHTFVSLENSDYDDEDLYPYMLGIRTMAESIFNSRCTVGTSDKLTAGVYFILSTDVNNILDIFIRAIQMVEVHMNLVREAEEEEEE